MTRRRKPKCGLSGSAAEHAAEFQTARHEALDAIHDAQHAMTKQKCLIAGKRIDDGYVAIGKMQASAQTGAEMAEASRVHGALEKADEPFEASCVRDTPIAPAMARKDGASALFRQNAGLAGISPAAALIAASIPMGVPGVPFMGLGAVPSHFEFEHPATAWFQPFGGPDVPMGGRLMFKRIEPVVARFNDELRFHFTAEWSGDLTITARVLADRWRYDLSRGNALGFVYTVDRQWLGGGERSVHENGILSDFDERDRQRLMVWLDALAENGLAGLGATEAELERIETGWTRPEDEEEAPEPDAEAAEIIYDEDEESHFVTAPAARLKHLLLREQGDIRVYRLLGETTAEAEYAYFKMPDQLREGPVRWAKLRAEMARREVVYQRETRRTWSEQYNPRASARVFRRLAGLGAEVNEDEPEVVLPTEVPIDDQFRQAHPDVAMADLFKRDGGVQPLRPNLMVFNYSTAAKDPSDPEQVADARARLHARLKKYPVTMLDANSTPFTVQQVILVEDAQSGQFQLVATYARETQAAKLVRRKSAEAPKAVKRLPGAEVPQVNPFVPQTAPPQAFGPALPKKLPALPTKLPAPKPAAPEKAEPKYKEGTFALPQRRAGPEPIAPSELERFFFAANAGAGFSERLYRIPRVKEDASPLEKLHQQQVSIALMPTSLTHEGQLFVRGQSFTLPAGETVISYRANTDVGTFVPHFPTEEQRKANDALILDLLTRARAPKTRPEFDKTWTDADPRTILQLSKPEAVRIRTKGAMEFWPVSTTRFILAHKPRAEMADLTFTAGRGYELKVPMTVLREATVQPNGLEFEVKHAGRAFIVTLPPTQANELQAWLGKSANSGLGELGLQGLSEVDEAARSWANTLLKHGVPPADWLFASMRGAPTKGFEHLPFVYISGYRPVPVGWADKFPPGTVVQVSMEGTRGVIRAASPLDPAVIARLELTPVRAGSIGAFFWATLSNGRALELSKDYGERARLIFKNPRGIWQSSEFVVDVGPTGHTEAPRPEELVWEAFAAGYRDANTGAVDAIMEGAQ